MPKDKYDTPNPQRKHTYMSMEDIVAGKKSSWFELEITGTVRNLCPSLWKLQHLTKLYLNDNNLTKIPPDIGHLEHLHHLDLSSNKIRFLPPEIGDLIQLRELLLNYNQLRVLPFELGRLFNLQSLGLVGNPLNPDMLKLYSEGTQKLLTYLLDSLVDEKLPKTVMIPPEELPKFNASQPPHRHWIPLARPEPGRHAGTHWLSRDNKSDREQQTRGKSINRIGSKYLSENNLPRISLKRAIFTVMCYNVLCDKYCTRQQYGYCPSWGLNWEYRKKGIMDEIRNCSADVICLQNNHKKLDSSFQMNLDFWDCFGREKYEVETDQFYNFFLPELEREGYNGIFSPKSRARTMTEQERKHVDGCAIFFRTTKFRLMKEHLIEFNQLAMANAEGSDEMLNRVMTKDNIGLAALLETKEGVFESSGAGSTPPEGLVKQPILIVTAHMHWDPEFSDVKLIQTMMLMSELKRIVEESYHLVRPNAPASLAPDCNTIPMILCGDLNSLPESGVIEYLSSGKVAGNHCDFKELGYEACLQTFNCNKDGTQLTHNFKLSRAYENDDMPHTNYTYDFKGIIDYIFFSRKYMNLLGLLGPMDENWFTDNKVVGCPHPHIPSDHFALFVEFELPVPYPAVSDIIGENKTSGSSTGRESSSSGGNLPKLR